MMKKKHIKIILIFLLLFLVFLSRWSIIDNIFFTFVYPIKSENLKTYINSEFDFSLKYPPTLSEIEEKENVVYFGNGVVPLIIVHVDQFGGRDSKEYISKQKEEENKSLNWFAKWNIFLLPALDSRGYSLNFVAGNLVFTISSPALAGAGGRLFRTYYISNGKLYIISSTSYSSIIGKYPLYKQFLRDFKLL